MKCVAVFFALLFGIECLIAGSPMITYTLEMPKPSTHVFEVTMNVDGVEKDSTLDVLLPVWRSGRYVILDFAGGIVAFNANDANKRKLDWSKIDKSTWRIETRGAANITIRYQVYANEFGMRTRGLNDDRAFVDGTAVFMYVKKYADLPVRLRVVPFGDWHVTTGLSPVRGERNTFSALNYEHLADCPLEIGTQKDYIFEVDGKEHVLSISGEGNFHPDTLIKDISRIINTQMEFWGSLPYDRYVFLLALSPSIGGGTEHLNSCVLCSHPFVFANPDSYRSFLGLISHEFFHTWNVKQLRPAAIDRYDWSRENYAKEFWIAEGTTSYYDDLLLARAGYLSEQKSLERVAEMINADVARPGNTRQSLTEASYDAWIKYGKEGQHAYNFETDYYGRGAAVSFALDMTIRKLTENRKSLDDVMRAMLAKFPRGRGGYTVADFQKISEEIAGASLKQFFDDYVDGVSPIPWDKLLAVVGLEREPKIAEQQPWLGLATVDEGQRTRVTNVVAGSPAYAAGVDINDEILALNGYRVRSADLRSRIAEMKDGEKVKLTVFRDSRLREFEIELKYPDYPDQKVVKTEPFADDKAAVFKSWIGLLDRVK